MLGGRGGGGGGGGDTFLVTCTVYTRAIWRWWVGGGITFPELAHICDMALVDDNLP